MLELIIKDAVLLHFTNNNNIFSTSQPAWILTQLLNVMEDWTSVMESGGLVDVVYFEFQKSF